MKIPIAVSESLYVPRMPEIQSMLDELREQFTHQNPDYWKRKKQGFYVGNMQSFIKSYAHVTHPYLGPCVMLPRGGTFKLRACAEQFGIELGWLDQRLSLEPVTSLDNDVELWPEQQRLAEIMFKKENCLIQSPTGSGKTETLLKVAEWILRTAGPVLIIVWEGSRRSGLMKQWIDRICERFGLSPNDVGVIGDGLKRIKPLTVGMQQTLKNVGRRYTQAFGGIICDEVQRFAAPTFQKVVGIYPARYRFGASADETRKDGKEFLIYESFGEVAGTVENAALIEKGKVKDVTVRIVPTGFDYTINVGGDEYSWIDLPSEDKNYNELLDVMTRSQSRDELIWHYIEKCLRSGRICLAGTHRVEHARAWDERVRAAGYTSGLMLGDKKNADEFETTKQGLQERKIQFGVGTHQKVATGHDITSLDRGFILTPIGGNKQLFNQFRGRLTRPDSRKTDVVLYYFWDQALYPSHKGAIARRYRGRTQVLVDGEFLTA
jgi:superfamily II DNA or RNA helicase